MRNTKTSIAVFTATITDPDEMRLLIDSVAGMRNDETVLSMNVEWLQSSASEGTVDGTAMFTQLTAVVQWLEKKPEVHDEGVG